jgi:hypothetical protein
MTAISLPATAFIDVAPVYCRPARANPWVRIGSYPSAADWHAAATILKRSGLQARMCDEPSGDAAFGMMVLVNEVHAAREFLSLPHFSQR